MSNENSKNYSSDDWFDQLLSKPVADKEIGVDEQVASAAGLTNPEDSELERIIQEAKAMDDTPDEAILPENDTETDIYPDEANSEELEDEPFTDEASQEEPEDDYQAEYEDEPENTRPKKKHRYALLGLPHLLSTVIWFAIAVIIGVSLGRMVWVFASDVLAFGKEDFEVVITVTENDNIDTISTKLKNAGLIRYPWLFKMYADLTDADQEIIAGTFTLRGIYDYNALVNFMSPHSSTREEVEVVIPEGYTCAQIFQLLMDKNVCSVEDLEEYAANGEFKDYWFLEGVPRGTKYCLEGYLFPDTYRFYLNDDAGNVLAKMLNNFDYRFTSVMKESLKTLNELMTKKYKAQGYKQDYIDAHLFTIREVVIIASMVEKETANDAESYDVSSVIYNRLTNPNYPVLNIDATIIYALGGNIDPETGKTKPLTAEDLKLDSPYNTYTKPGLIPGPISNPGRNSLDAALNPNDTKYHYYVLNPKTHVHLFAKDKDEHDRNVAYVKSLD